MSSLRAAFLAALDPSARPAFEELSHLPERLEAIAASARAAHPGVVCPAETFATGLAVRLPAEVPQATALDTIHGGDLYLALACARGDAAAIASFERMFGGELDRAAAKSKSTGLTSDELRQLLATKFFVSEDGQEPRIASYAARGPLRSWVRVAAVRATIDIGRRNKGSPIVARDDAMLDRMGANADPELVMMKHAYGAELPRAFEEAIACLTVRQRNLLRQRYLHNISADKLATLYSVHRATAFGWIEDARRDLLQHVRTALAARVPGAELESVLDLLASQLHVSVGRLLDPALEREADRAR